MLGKILSREECAKCRLCCSFDSYDIWETPVIPQKLAGRIIQEFDPDIKFIKKDDHFLIKMEKEKDRDLYYCSLLDHQKGCIMGEDKPFDCVIWPYRIMSFQGKRVITLSPVCPVVQTRPLEKLMEVAKDIAPQVFAYGDENPDAVKPYIAGYPIMLVEEEEFVKK